MRQVQNCSRPEIMKVYLVSRGEWEWSDGYGIFSSLEKAKECCDKIKIDYSCIDEYELDEILPDGKQIL